MLIFEKKFWTILTNANVLLLLLKMPALSEKTTMLL